MKKIFVAIIIMIMLTTNITALISKGHTHINEYYTISFDGEGDAIVRAKLVIRNTEKTDLRKLTLEFPSNVIFYDLYQEISYNHHEKIEQLDEQKTSTSTILELRLPEKLQEDETTSITILYKQPRLAKKFLGAYNFRINTIIDTDAKLIENIRVAINVNEGLYMKGQKAEVNYQPDFFGSMAAESFTSKAISDDAYYNQYSREIERAKGYVKTAQNLDPWESFSVEGKYSKYFFRIHFIPTLLAMIGIAFLIYLFTKITRIKLPKSNTTQLVVLTSLAQSIALALLWAAAWFSVKSITNWVGNRYDEFFGVLLIMLFAVLIISTFLMPPILLGTKKGKTAGVITFMLTITWLIVIIIFGALIVSLI